MGNVCCDASAGKTVGEIASKEDVAAITVKQPEPERAPEPPKEPVPEPAKEPEPPAPEPVAPKAEEPPKATLSIVFNIDLQNQQKQATCTFTEQPLGMTFEQKSPLTVKTVEEGGAADKAGVRPGFSFVKIGEVDVKDKEPKDAVEDLKQGYAPLPNARAYGEGFVIVFATKPGYTKTVTFTKKPLGLVCDTTKPVVVKKVSDGSNAALLGVKPGWEIRFVGGESVAGLSGKATLDKIKEGSATLKS